MPATPKRGKRFGGNAKHQRLMMANLVCSLVASPTGIVTTEAKAKALRPIAEKMITKARKGGLHNHRQILAFLGDQEVQRRVGRDEAEHARLGATVVFVSFDTRRVFDVAG